MDLYFSPRATDLPCARRQIGTILPNLWGRATSAVRARWLWVASFAATLAICGVVQADDGQSGAGARAGTGSPLEGGMGLTTLDVIEVFGSGLGDLRYDILSWSAWNDMVRDSSLFMDSNGDLAYSDGISADANRPSCGNPIIPSSANKVQKEMDFRMKDLEMPLYLERTYDQNLSITGGGTIGRTYSLFGSGWTTNFDYWMWGEQDENLNSFLIIAAPDGRYIKFKAVGGGRYDEDKPNPIAYLTAYTSGNDWYVTHHTEDNRIEQYKNGYIQTLRNENGVGWDFTYEPFQYPGAGGGQVWTRQRLRRVTHNSGRYVEFTYGAGNAAKVATVRDPAGNLFHYASGSNAAGTFSKVTRPDGSEITYQYDPYAMLLQGKSINGVRYATFTYQKVVSGINLRYFPVASEHAGGVDKTSFVYSYSSDLKKVTGVTETNPLGKKTTITYNDKGDVLTVVGQASPNCAGGYREITYDANGHRDLVSDFNSNVTDFDYAPNGQMLKKIEAAGTPRARTTQYAWDPAKNRLISTTVVGERSTAYSYGPDNRLTEVRVTNLSAHGVPGQVHSTVYAYTVHPNGLVATVTVDGPLPGAGDAVTTSYGSLGQLVSQQNSLGHVVSYQAYNDLGLPGRRINVNGEMTDYSYDVMGRVLRERSSVNGSFADTDYTYIDGGLLSSVLTPDGVRLQHEYDPARRLARTWRLNPRLAGGGTHEEQRFTHDAMGNVIRTEVKKLVGGTWVLTGRSMVDYDELGRPIARRGNNGQNVRYAYDGNGNVVLSIDSLNKTTTYGYDELDRLVSSTNPLNGITRFKYDHGDRITLTTDPRGLNTAHVYDGFGQLWAENSPDTGAATFQYNAGGQLALLTRNDASTLSYVYDAVGRLAWYGTAQEGRAFGYDWCQNGKSRLCNADYSNGTRHYAYAHHGQVVGTLDWTASSSDWTAFAYDTVGRLTGIAYPSGVSAGYGYADGALSAMTVTVDGVTRNVLSGIQYEPLGAVASWDYGNGLSRHMYYDQNYVAGDGRLTGLTTMDGTATVQSLLMQYDLAERVSTINNYITTSMSQTYAYDALSRLTGVVSPAANENLQYDANGNRTMHDWLAPIANDVDPGSNRILADHAFGGDGIDYVHDARGNRSTQYWNGSTASYQYDAYNQLKSVSRTAPSSYHNGGYVMMNYPATTTTYITDAQSRRIAKTNNTLSARYVYAEGNHLLAENNNGQWTTHLWLAGQPVGLVRGSAVYWSHTDHTGRPEILTDASRQVVWRARNFHSERGVVQDSVGGYNLGLPGQYFDAESGLWYNGFRYYDSRLGRFTQSDPIGLEGGLNTYSYAAENPVNRIDPSGLDGMYITFPDYMVNLGHGVEMSLGHAGVVAIDDSTGSAYYFDFGRYGGEYGDVRGPIYVGKVQFVGDGVATRESLDAVAKRAAEFGGKGGAYRYTYGAEHSAKKIMAFALNRQKNVANFPYSFKKPNVCYTFAMDAFDAGGRP